MMQIDDLQAFLDSKIIPPQIKKDDKPVVGNEELSASNPDSCDVSQIISDMAGEYGYRIFPLLDNSSDNLPSLQPVLPSDQSIRIDSYSIPMLNRAEEELDRLAKGYPDDTVYYMKFRLAQAKYVKTHNKKISLEDI